MSKVNAFEADILDLIFTNVNLSNIGDATGLRGSSVAGNLYIALFTASPGETGSAANEATYTGYARVAVTRSLGSWTVSGTAPTECKNDNAVTFPAATGGSNVVTHFAVCKAGTSGISDLIYHGALTSSLTVSSGITPEFAANSITISED